MDNIPTYNYFILAALFLGALYSLFLGLKKIPAAH